MHSSCMYQEEKITQTQTDMLVMNLARCLYKTAAELLW